MSAVNEKPTDDPVAHDYARGSNDSSPSMPSYHNTKDITERKKSFFGANVDNESMVSDTTLVADEHGLKPAFLAKANLINNALSEIGMGRYQYELFFSGGFGW